MDDDNEFAELEEYLRYDAAVATVQSLHSRFKVVSEFLQNPLGTIAEARSVHTKMLRDFSSYKFTLHKLTNVFSSVAQHQAEVSLLLNIENCIAANRKLISLCDHATHFKPGSEGYSYDRLSEDIAETGSHVILWTQHVTNCLDVLRGHDKKVKNLNGPS